MTLNSTPMRLALALLLSPAALIATPVSAQTLRPRATEHHVPSHTMPRHAQTAPVHKKTVRRPVHTVPSHRTARKPSDRPSLH